MTGERRIHKVTSLLVKSLWENCGAILNPVRYRVLGTLSSSAEMPEAL